MIRVESINRAPAPRLRYWVVTVVGAALIYLLPMLTMRVDEASEVKSLYSLIPLLVTNPLISLVVVFVTARGHGAWALLAFTLLIAVFVASVFTLYNSSALIYAVPMLGSALIGWALAYLLRNRRGATE